MFFYILFEFTNGLQKKNEKIKLDEQRYSFLEEYYKEIELHQNEVRGMKHDMNNQLLTMKGQLFGNELSNVKENIEDIFEKSGKRND